MSQEDLEQKFESWVDNIKVLVETLSQLSVDELKQVIDSLPEEQKKRMFVILNAEKSLISTMSANQPRYIYNEEAQEEE